MLVELYTMEPPPPGSHFVPLLCLSVNRTEFWVQSEMVSWNIAHLENQSFIAFSKISQEGWEWVHNIAAYSVTRTQVQCIMIFMTCDITGTAAESQLSLTRRPQVGREELRHDISLLPSLPAPRYFIKFPISIVSNALPSPESCVTKSWYQGLVAGGSWPYLLPY